MSAEKKGYGTAYDLLAMSAGGYPSVWLPLPELCRYLKLVVRALNALGWAEILAARQTEDLRIARNRIANAADRVRAAKRLLGCGDTVEGANEVARALDYLTQPNQEGS